MNNPYYQRNNINIKKNTRYEDFCSKKENIWRSLNQVESFLCNYKDFWKIIRLYRILK